MKSGFSPLHLHGKKQSCRVFWQYLQQLGINNFFRKATRSKNWLILLMLVTILLLPFTGRSQGAYPRDGNESLAMRIHDWYAESQKKLIALKAELPRAEKNAKQFINLPGDHEDLDRLNQIKADIEKEERRIRKYDTAWEKNRTTPPAPARSFALRYGPLIGSLKPSTDARYDMVESAIRNFPFDVSAANDSRKSVVSTQNAISAPGGTFTAEKGTTDSWSDIKVTLGNVVKFKTEDKQSWRNNGTGFTAYAAGSGPVTIKIEVIGRAGVSYFDYNADVSVKASNVDMLVSDKPVISKDGGTKTYSVVWDPSAKPGGVNINVSIRGGNPDFFTYFVSGWIGGR
jgi:hypothetical protein